MRRVAVFAWSVGVLAATLVLSGTDAFERVDRLWRDAGARLAAPAEAPRSVLVFDLGPAAPHADDDAAAGNPAAERLRLAEAAAALLEQGAQAVVFNLPLTDPQAGDAALRSVAERHPGRVVFGADARRQLSTAGHEPDQRLRRLAWQLETAADAPRWAQVVPPADSVLPTAPRVGVLPTVADADGRLRCATLLHRVDGLALPSLVLAALAVASGPPAVDGGGDARRLEINGRPLHLTGRGCVAPLLPRDATGMTRLHAADLAGHPAPGAPQQASPLAGRTVFVGRPAAGDAVVLTPTGPLPSTAWQALAFAALESGAVLAPRLPAVDALLLLLALAPLAVAAPGAAPGMRRMALALSGAAVLLGVLALGALLVAAQQTALPRAGLALAGTAVALGVLHRRRQLRQRARDRAARRNRQAVSRAKAEFLAHLDHEIRTPVNAMLGITRLLAETPLTPLQHRYVETLRTAGRHVLDLADDALDLARVEAGEVTLVAVPFSPRDLAAELKVLFEPPLHAKGLLWHDEVSPDCPLAVVGDARRVRQVLVHLIGNAVRFTARGGVTLALRPGTEAGSLEFVVRDTGIGFPADRRAARVLPAGPGSADDGPPPPTSGLGLAITLRLVRALGGQLSLDSEAGRGTEVTVRLPLPPAPGPDGSVLPLQVRAAQACVAAAQASASAEAPARQPADPAPLRPHSRGP